MGIVETLWLRSVQWLGMPTGADAERWRKIRAESRRRFRGLTFEQKRELFEGADPDRWRKWFAEIEAGLDA